MIEFEEQTWQRAVSALTAHFTDRRVIVVGAPLAATGTLLRQLRDLGARRPFVLAPSIGTGVLPEPDDAEWLSLDVKGGDPTIALRRYENLLVDLPPAARRALDRYDPAGSALVVGLILLQAVPEVAGRRRFGVRSEAWRELEDKVLVDAFWDRAGVVRAPSSIVATTAPLTELAEVAAALDAGAGTVWAGDARDGLHGGAFLLHRVRGEAELAAAVEQLRPACDRARVMPFLEGIPCSIHGIVCGEGELILRPVEMVTLLRSDSSQFLYAGASTHWDPPSPQRGVMREVARRTAHGLRALAPPGHGGAFTVDGVLTRQGFLPTELNPRIGYGLLLLEDCLPRRSSGGPWPLGLLALAAGEGLELGDAASLAALERVVVAAADARRSGRARALVDIDSVPTATTAHHLALGYDGHLRLAAAGEASVGEMALGPSFGGAFVTFAPAPELIAPGSSLGSMAVEVFALADRELGTQFGALEAARAAG